MTAARRESRASKLDYALRRGIDDLQCRLEWALRNRPRPLARWRRKYRRYGKSLYLAIERAARPRP